MIRPLKYPGGKWKQIDWVTSHFGPHYHYVDVFGGGAAILLSKSRSRIETYNDINGDVVNYFKCLRDYPDQLIRAIKLTPYSRQEYNQSILSGHSLLISPIERARQFALKMNMDSGFKARGGWMFFVNGKRTRTFADEWANTDKLYAIAERLQGVQIENTSFEKIIPIYDTPDTLFYCDPPYHPDTRQKAIYLNEMSEESHLVLLEMIKGVKGKVVISGYDHPTYNEMLKGWQRKEKTAYTIMHSKRREVIWVSPGITNTQMSLPIPLK